MVRERGRRYLFRVRWKEVKKINDELRGRLYNWKFESALNYLENEDESVVNETKALAATLGNVGWSLRGTMGVLVAGVVKRLIGGEDKVENE